MSVVKSGGGLMRGVPMNGRRAKRFLAATGLLALAGCPAFLSDFQVVDDGGSVDATLAADSGSDTATPMDAIVEASPSDSTTRDVDATAADTGEVGRDAVAESSSDAGLDTSNAVDTGVDTAPTCTQPTTPMLTNTQGTHGGIQFHVNADTTLTSFTFTSQGVQDTVTLTDDQCNAIASASTPGEPLPGYMPYTVNVHWPLQAGVTYRLTDTNGQTAFTTAVTTFPYTSGVLTVTKGLVVCPDQGPEGQVWTAFTDLVFCSADGGLMDSGANCTDSSPKDSGPSGGMDSGDSGCGPTDTVTNCGACGNACNTTTGTPSCTGSACTYVCKAGLTDCNASVGTDTDGCECMTTGATACCGTACANTHSDGVGQTFYNCNPVPTHTEVEAIDACVAYETSVGISATMAAAGCSGGWSCDSGSPPFADLDVCYVTGSGASQTFGAYCWEYQGSHLGQAVDSSCPKTVQGPFN